MLGKIVWSLFKLAKLAQNILMQVLVMNCGHVLYCNAAGMSVLTVAERIMSMFQCFVIESGWWDLSHKTLRM